MKLNLKSKIPLAFAAGTFAVALGGCASTEHFMDRMTSRGADSSAERSTAAESRAERRAERNADNADRAGYMNSSVYSNASNTPPSIDPFSPRYVPFPASDNESPAMIGQSAFCVEHYSQPGCQTARAPAYDRAGRPRGYYDERRSEMVYPNGTARY